jgi:hypothetical protein
MKYFGHESDASDDYRLGNIIEKYSLDGSGLYWYCNERITRNIDPPNGIDCQLMDDIDKIARIFQKDVGYITEILDYFVEMGAYTKKDGHYQNLKLLKRLDRYSRKKAKDLGISLEPNDTPGMIRDKMIAKYEEKKMYPRGSSGVRTNGTQTVHSVSTVCTKSELKRKEKKRKENKIKLSIAGGVRPPGKEAFAAKAKKPGNDGPAVEDLV